MNTIKIYGIVFDIEKKGKEYKIMYHGFKASEGKTKKEAIQKVKNQCYKKGKAEIINCCLSVLRDIVKDKLFDKYANSLKCKFGFSIPVCRAFMLLKRKRIDIVQLDKLLRVPEGISLKSYIFKRYGKEYSNMVNSMI